MKVVFRCGAYRDDPEKLVLPSVVWLSGGDELHNGCSIAVGWWHFAATVTLLWKRRNPLPDSVKG
jgi:hypothetical protein